VKQRGNWVIGLLAGVVSMTPGTALSASQSDLSAFHVYLNDGRVLHTFGECATLPTELVCVVKLGGGPVPESHDLLTVPRSLVDEARTTEYARALRAAQYGATRGEQEYAALTTDITRVLAELESSTDRDRRLGIAQVARKRLAGWSADHFGYKADETRQLVAMLDEVIAELRLAAGDRSFALDLVANVAPVETPPLLPVPAVTQALEAALLAAEDVTPVAAERLAILRSAHRVAGASPDADAALRARVATALEVDEALDRQFRALVQSVAARSDVAVQRGRPSAFPQLIREVNTTHARLGLRRPHETAALIRRLEREQELAREQQVAFVRWSQVRSRLFAYEVRVRPVFNAFEAHRHVLNALREGDAPRPSALDAAGRRVGALDGMLASLQPLPELAQVHAVLQSAVQMARHGLVLGQRLAVAPNSDIERTASSAVAGAEMLLAQARADLIVALNPRRVR
jgi:hypothetical protein